MLRECWFFAGLVLAVGCSGAPTDSTGGATGAGAAHAGATGGGGKASGGDTTGRGGAAGAGGAPLTMCPAELPSDGASCAAYEVGLTCRLDLTGEGAGEFCVCTTAKTWSCMSTGCPNCATGSTTTAIGTGGGGGLGGASGGGGGT
jgi:hypothetical protein